MSWRTLSVSIFTVRTNVSMALVLFLSSMQPDLFGQPLVSKHIRLLTWRPPFAALMLPPHNKIETRERYTSFRGSVLIHNGLKPFLDAELFDLCGPEIMADIIERMKDDPLNVKMGHVIAIGDLVDCRVMKKNDEKSCFVEYKKETIKYCWIFENVKKVEPFPLRGQQSFITLYPHLPKHQAILNQIKIL